MERPLKLDSRRFSMKLESLVASYPHLERLESWSAASLEDAIRLTAEGRAMKLGQLAQPLRAALTGTTVSPGIFEVMEVLDRDETLGRLDDALGAA